MFRINKKYIFGISLLLVIFLVGVLYVTASSSGPNNPGTVINNASIGTVAWSNPTDAKTSNNVYSSVSLLNAAPAARTSNYLKATNFSFSIPAGATINGIVVEIERKADFDIKDTAVRIIKSNGAIGTTNKGATGTFWPATDGTATYGSSADLWGETWASTDINDVDFGVVLAANNPGTDVDDAVAYVDHMKITVYYTEATSCSPPAINNNWNVSMADFCIVSSSTNLGTGNITFYNQGNFTINNTLNIKNMQNPLTNQTINIKQGANVRIG